jgi:hypothetical protein
MGPVQVIREKKHLPVQLLETYSGAKKFVRSRLARI